MSGVHLCGRVFKVLNTQLFTNYVRYEVFSCKIDIKESMSVTRGFYQAFMRWLGECQLTGFLVLPNEKSS